MADQGTGLLSPWLLKKRKKMAYPYIQGRVLDYGCGVGVITDMCKSDIYWGVDIDEESLGIARRNHPQFHFAAKVAETEKFDTIVALAVIEHVSDPAALLAQLKQSLRSGGCIVMTTPHPFFEWIHTLGAKIGLFSIEASEEHKQPIDYRLMQELVANAGLVIEQYKRFLLGANQLFVLRQ